MKITVNVSATDAITRRLPAHGLIDYEVDLTAIPANLAPYLADMGYDEKGKFTLYPSIGEAIDKPLSPEIIADYIRAKLADAEKVLDQLSANLADTKDRELLEKAKRGYIQTHVIKQYGLTAKRQLTAEQLSTVNAQLEKMEAQRKAKQERDDQEAAARKAERDAADKRAEEAKAATEAEKIAWIDEHGSKRLQRCVAEGIEHEAIYRDERLAVDRAGFCWMSSLDRNGQRVLRDDPRNPPEKAFDLLDEARAIAPDAALEFLTLWREATDEDDAEDIDDDNEVCVDRRTVPVAKFLGRDIYFAAAFA